MTMIHNEFQSTLFSTTSQMLCAIAEAFLSANGSNSPEFQSEYMAQNTDDELAAQCIDGFGLDSIPSLPEDSEKSHMEFNDYTEADLAKAFAAMRD